MEFVIHRKGETMSLSEDMRAMKDNTKIKDGRSRLYLKNGYIDYPSRLEILDLAGCDDNCTYLGAVEVSEVHAPVAIFRSPFAPGEMPDEFRQGIEEAYYYQFPDVHKKIEEPKGAKVPPTLGVFILPPGRKKYPYRIKFHTYKPEEKKKNSFWGAIKERFAWQ